MDDSDQHVQMRVEGPHVAIVNNHDQVEIKRISLGRDLGNRVVVSGHPRRRTVGRQPQR